MEITQYFRKNIMKVCQDCKLNSYDCICAVVDLFFKENGHLIQRNNEKDKENRCLACFFAPCRCKEGLANKPN